MQKFTIQNQEKEEIKLTTFQKIRKIIHLICKLVYTRLKIDFTKEYQNIRFWYILTFAGGILFNFFCNNVYYLIYILMCSLLILLTYLYSHLFKKNTSIIRFFLLFFLLGFTISFLKSYNTPKGSFTTPEYNITFEGKVESIKLTSHENILILTATKAPNTQLYNGKIRIKYDPLLLQNQSLNNGDIVKIKTSLIPIKYSSFPQDKSYENYAKFFDVIASGKAKNIEIIRQESKKHSLFSSNTIQKYRNSIQQRIYEVNNHTPGAGIVIAVLTGNNSFIPKDQLSNIRHSGCAHILAISGLHMSIVVAFVFAFFIHFFALFPHIALRFNTKKLAVFPAIIACLFYIQIANIPISATRSFLMVAIACITLLLNRAKSSLNALFITFFVMLCFSPDYILSPSFQMSFMAVFGLTTIYTNNCINESSVFSRKKTLFKYISGILLSSVVATICTVFFEIYHFKQYAWIGLLSNIPVIPITEFLVLPFGFIGMLFNNTIIGDLCYMISGFFANIVCIITDFTANLQYSFLLTSQMTDQQLIKIVAGMIILLLSKSKILKIAGCLLFLIGFISYILNPKFVLIYNQNLKNVVFFENDKYYSVKPIKSDYIQSVWSQNLGVKEILLMNDDENKAINCTTDEYGKEVRCEYTYKNQEPIIISKGKSNNVIGVKIVNNKPIFLK